MNTNTYKEKLLEEKLKLEAELETVGAKNPKNPADWEGKELELNTDEADEGEVAFADEELSTNNAVVSQLELRLAEVNSALEKISAGTYGVCEIGGEIIEEDRLHANPAAKTCKAHM